MDHFETADSFLLTAHFFLVWNNVPNNSLWIELYNVKQKISKKTEHSALYNTLRRFLQGPKYDFLIFLSPFSRSEEETRMRQLQTKKNFLLRAIKLCNEAFQQYVNKLLRKLQIKTNFSPRTIDFLETWRKSIETVIWKLLKTYLIFWCKTCNHRRVCRRFLKEVENNLRLAVLVLLLRLNCALMVYHADWLLFVPNDTKARWIKAAVVVSRSFARRFQQCVYDELKILPHSKILESKFYLK